jgi:hypothetical protein
MIYESKARTTKPFVALLRKFEQKFVLFPGQRERIDHLPRQRTEPKRATLELRHALRKGERERIVRFRHYPQEKRNPRVFER